jgi:cytoskeletal protein RodZ
MKEIGETLKETRENMGISVEEVAEDLKITPAKIIDIEEGNIKAFKDIYSLKYFVRDYSKYLGLDYDSMIDEFNEYLFDYTSKLSIDEIRKASDEDKKRKENPEKISSPYTIERDEQRRVPRILIWLLIILVLACVGFVIYKTTQTTPSNIIE